MLKSVFELRVYVQKVICVNIFYTLKFVCVCDINSYTLFYNQTNFGPVKFSKFNKNREHPM